MEEVEEVSRQFDSYCFIEKKITKFVVCEDRLHCVCCGKCSFRKLVPPEIGDFGAEIPLQSTNTTKMNNTFTNGFK